MEHGSGVENFIDLDNDWAKLTINGVVVHQWPFSYQSGSTTGTNRLGCVDFFSSSGDGSTGKYYIDDIHFQPYNDPLVPVSNWSVMLAFGMIVLAILFFRIKY